MELYDCIMKKFQANFKSIQIGENLKILMLMRYDGKNFYIWFCVSDELWLNAWSERSQYGLTVFLRLKSKRVCL